eukprot:53039-Pyramimonas_sp.AAC.1
MAEQREIAKTTWKAPPRGGAGSSVDEFIRVREGARRDDRRKMPLSMDMDMRACVEKDKKD